jgi:hypothetical protein
MGDPDYHLCLSKISPNSGKLPHGESAQQRVEKATEERDKLKGKLKKAQARLAAEKQCVSSASAVVRQDCANEPLTSALPELRLPGAGA